MAKMFYSLEETCEKLSMSEDQIKDLVRQARLREFRDAGKVNYKVEEVDALVSNIAADSGAGPKAADSGSGELVLEPAEESTIDLAMGSTGDMLSLEEVDADETTAGQEGEKKKDDTVVTSVGISVFDEEEDVEGVADPLAQTVVSGASAGGLGIEGVGSGSGLLDLTRESDDTSLGAELLDEIYPEESGSAAVEMGEATRAGLEEAIGGTPAGGDIFEASRIAESVPEPAAPPSAAVEAPVETGPDPLSNGLTGLLVVAVGVMGFAGLAVAGSVRGVSLPMIEFLYAKLWMFGLGALVVGGLATGIGFWLGKRSEG